MGWISSSIIGIAVALPLYFVSAAPTNSSDMQFSFSSPAFSGIGYGNHVLTLEQLEFNRQKSIDDRLRTELDRAERDIENNNLNRFVNNIETRIYSQLSRNIVEQLFDEDNNLVESDTVVNIDGNIVTIDESSEPDTILITVLGADGALQEIRIPTSGLSIGTDF